MLRYRSWGSGTGPLVFLLHAQGCHSGWWNWVAPHLPSRWRAVAPDLRGHGDSPQMGDYRFAAYAADLEALWQSLGGGPCAIVGHSMGAYVGLIAAATTRMAPAALLIADMKTGTTPEELEQMAAAAARPARPFPTLAEAVGRFRLTPAEHAVPADRLAAVAEGSFRESPEGWVPKFDRRALAIEPVEPERYLGQVRCPVLVVRGERSTVMEAGPAAALGNLVTMEGLYHHLPLEAPEGFAALAAGFVEPNLPAWEAVNRDSFSRQAESFHYSAFVRGPREVGTIARLADLDPSHELLEVACGTGAVLLNLAPHVRRAVGLDLTPEMLAVARAKAPANVELMEGLADALPFADGSFDRVVNRLAIHHFGDPALCLREMARVLKPGGLLALADLYCSEDPARADRCNAIERFRDPAHVAFQPSSRLRAMVEAAGLQIIAEERWENERTLTEWTAITAPPGGMEPLRQMMLGAVEGDAAGMEIRVREDGEVLFTHRWVAVAARKPLAGPVAPRSG